MAIVYTFSGTSGVRFEDRRSGQCATPLWGDADRIGLVCGKPTAEGRSYCPDCAAKMTLGAPSLKEYLMKLEGRL
jgi:hypothetical protein